jgi:hypothetical protein
MLPETKVTGGAHRSGKAEQTDNEECQDTVKEKGRICISGKLGNKNDSNYKKLTEDI